MDQFIHRCNFKNHHQRFSNHTADKERQQRCGNKRYLKRAIQAVVLALVASVALSVFGLLAVQAQNVKSIEPIYRTPEDVMIKLVPILGKIPRSFRWGAGYKVKLNADRLEIGHKGRRLPSESSQRAFRLSLAYTTPFANLFSTGLDLPLFSGDQINYASMAFNHQGDYDVFVSRRSVGHDSLQMVLRARF